jgi:uncharacterized protein
MNIVVAQISEDEGLEVHHRYREGDLDLRGGDAHLVGDASLNVQATRAGEEVRLVGEVKAVVGFECDRCLGLLATSVQQSFDLTYLPPLRTQDEQQLGTDDLSVAFYQGEVIDADDLVREQIELALPMVRLCSEDCKGLCPDCGANLNEGQCACQTEQVDARWAALKELRSKLS